MKKIVNLAVLFFQLFFLGQKEKLRQKKNVLLKNK